MKLSIRSLTITSAILWGGSVFVIGVANVIWPTYGVAFLQLVASIYPGYHATESFGSVIVGTLYGILDGAVGGLLFVAIYNDQGRASKYWLKIKQAYNALPGPLRWLVVLPCFVRLWGPTTIRDVFRGVPFGTWRSYRERNPRGMDPWRDVVDWVGGLPFEVAQPEEIFYFYREWHFELERLKTCAGGHVCNEYVFSRPDGSRKSAIE